MRTRKRVDAIERFAEVEKVESDIKMGIETVVNGFSLLFSNLLIHSLVIYVSIKLYKIH